MAAAGNREIRNIDFALRLNLAKGTGELPSRRESAGDAFENSQLHILINVRAGDPGAAGIVFIPRSKLSIPRDIAWRLCVFETGVESNRVVLAYMIQDKMVDSKDKTF